MLEKNGSVLLTREDLDLYNRGLVSKRLQDTWNLDLEALREIVENNNYQLVDGNNDKS